MSICVIIVLGILTLIFGSRLLVTVLVSGLMGWLLCDIDVDKEYTWYSGIWHGIFFVPNFIRFLVWDTSYKAELYTTGYNIWYWIFSIVTTVSYIFGGGSRNRQY